jgi:hypothetical protein
MYFVEQLVSTSSTSNFSLNIASFSDFFIWIERAEDDEENGVGFGSNGCLWKTWLLEEAFLVRKHGWLNFVGEFRRSPEFSRVKTGTGRFLLLR